MSIFKAAVAVLLTIGVVVSCSQQDDVEQQRAQLLKQTFEEVTELMPNESQFCRRGAALTLVGRYAEAEQYEESFGRCMRAVVKEWMLQ